VEAKFFLINFCGFNMPRRNLNVLPDFDEGEAVEVSICQGGI